MLSWAKYLSHKVLSRINDYTEPMMILTTWAKIYSTKYFYNAMVAGLDKILSTKYFQLYFLL